MASKRAKVDINTSLFLSFCMPYEGVTAATYMTIVVINALAIWMSHALARHVFRANSFIVDSVLYQLRITHFL